MAGYHAIVSHTATSSDEIKSCYDSKPNNFINKQKSIKNINWIDLAFINLARIALIFHLLHD